MTSPWREPDEESIDLYPGLVVHDGRVTGSITVGQSRLPLWAFAAWLPDLGWDEVVKCWDNIETEYGWTAEKMGGFLHDVTQCRGEFARLLLVLANVNRLDDEREAAALEPHGPLVNVTPGDPNAVSMPAPWWDVEELRQPVIVQLRRCLAALEDETPAAVVTLP